LRLLRHGFSARSTVETIDLRDAQGYATGTRVIIRLPIDTEDEM
jgi:hypothetical protein